MRKVLEQCPACGNDLEVTRLSCPACGIVILGQFEPCSFCSLSPEEMNLALTFIKCRGNVREMERELDISYWTMRRMIDDLIRKLGFDVDTEQEAEMVDMQEILDRLDRGEISAAEANEALARAKHAREQDES